MKKLGLASQIAATKVAYDRHGLITKTGKGVNYFPLKKNHLSRDKKYSQMNTASIKRLEMIHK